MCCKLFTLIEPFLCYIFRPCPEWYEAKKVGDYVLFSMLLKYLHKLHVLIYWIMTCNCKNIMSSVLL